MADDKDWIAILILSPLKSPTKPSYFAIIEAVSMILLYFIWTGF